MFPPSFVRRLRSDLGDAQAEHILEVMKMPPPVTVRTNPLKTSSPLLDLPLPFDRALEISRYGYLLGERPVFTTDPLFQCGCYYVQEASSMAIERVIASGNIFSSTDSGEGLRVLDLCAAPGGKSTHLLTLLRERPGSFLVSNEVIGSRVTVLADNIARWGHPNVLVTNNDPADFCRLPEFFDVLLIDAPCSGEGMFRKDERAVTEWSEENVALCAARQRRIISDAMVSLRPGGTLLYSTCTLNTIENEENVAWAAREFGMEILGMEHFYPGEEYGEGLFIAALRSHREGRPAEKSHGGRRRNAESTLKEYRGEIPFIKEGYRVYQKDSLLKVFPAACAETMLSVESRLKTVKSGTGAASVITDRKGQATLIPEPDLAFSEVLLRKGDGGFPEVELDAEQALKFMKCEPLNITDAPKGYLLLTFLGHPLGFVKNIGSRANNLWPSSRRIRM